LKLDRGAEKALNLASVFLNELVLHCFGVKAAERVIGRGSGVLEEEVVYCELRVL